MLERFALTTAPDKFAQSREFVLAQGAFELQIKFNAPAIQNVREQVLCVQAGIVDPALLEIRCRRMQHLKDSHSLNKKRTRSLRQSAFQIKALRMQPPPQRFRAAPSRPQLAALESTRRDRRSSRDPNYKVSDRCDDRSRGSAGNCRYEFFPRVHRCQSGRGAAHYISPLPRAASARAGARGRDRKSTRLNSSHPSISYAVFCLKKKTQQQTNPIDYPIENNNNNR